MKNFVSVNLQAGLEEIIQADTQRPLERNPQSDDVTYTLCVLFFSFPHPRSFTKACGGLWPNTSHNCTLVGPQR